MQTGETEVACKIFAQALPVLVETPDLDRRFVEEVLEVYDPVTGEVRIR